MNAQSKKATLSKVPAIPLVALVHTLFAAPLPAAEVVTGIADGAGTIRSGEYTGAAFTAHLRGEYSGFGPGTLTTGAGTVVQIGSERFEAVVSPAFGTFQSLCCGEGAVADWFLSMNGQLRHVTAAQPHNHLFAASATAGSMCINIMDQSGSVVTPSDPPHDPGINLICDIAATVAIHEAARTVAIDVKPGTAINAINPTANGVIPVAILSTDDFDATTVDALTVRFGRDGAAEIHGRAHLSDVNADGRRDLVLHFATEATGIVAGDTSASLTGATLDGEAIEGSDAIVTVSRQTPDTDHSEPLRPRTNDDRRGTEESPRDYDGGIE
jgi:hypothetical protein